MTLPSAAAYERISPEPMTMGMIEKSARDDCRNGRTTSIECSYLSESSMTPKISYVRFKRFASSWIMTCPSGVSYASAPLMLAFVNPMRWSGPMMITLVTCAPFNTDAAWAAVGPE